MHVPRRTFPLAVPLAIALVGLVASASHAQTYALTTLATFNGYGNGGNPQGALTLSADAKTLLGTTKYGGGFGQGTIFSVPVGGGAVTTLATFTGPNGADPSGVLTPGAGGLLYGTTVAGGNGGGANGYGTVFALNPGTGALTTLAMFNSANGSSPVAGLTLVGSSLYGTTYTGGTHNDGTVFSVPTGGGAPATLVDFRNGDFNGIHPQSFLTLSADGTTFYGTATGGGNNGHGTLFSVPIAGGALTNLYTFPDGSCYAGLTPSADGRTLFGTAYYGPGLGGNGTVFSLDTRTGTVTTLAALSYANGANLYAGLTLSADGKTLFGTATSGGSGNGTVFSLPVTGGTVTTLVTFTGPNGANPVSGLTLGPDGTLYGTTYGSGLYGGAGGDGTVFSLTPTPEPSQTAALGLGALGLVGMVIKARRRKGTTA